MSAKTWIALVGLLGGSAAWAAEGPVPTPPGSEAFTLGALKVIALRDASYVADNDGQTFGVDAGAKAVGGVLSAAGLPTDRITLSVNALLVVEPGHLILLDTGLGSGASGGLPASLHNAGFTPGQITDILVTHTHGDHVGGLIDASGHSAFPNATVRMSEKEWAWAKRQPGAERLVRAIQTQVEVFTPGAPVLPGVTPVAVDGHTPGHVGYEIASGGARIFDIGDTAHSSVISLAKPDWTMGFDEDPAQGKVSRRAILMRLARSQELVFAPHFPFPGVGHVDAQGDGFIWRPGLK